MKTLTYDKMGFAFCQKQEGCTELLDLLFSDPTQCGLCDIEIRGYVAQGNPLQYFRIMSY